MDVTTPVRAALLQVSTTTASHATQVTTELQRELLPLIKPVHAS